MSPSNNVSIPRRELNGIMLAVKKGTGLKKEFEILKRNDYWTFSSFESFFIHLPRWFHELNSDFSSVPNNLCTTINYNN